MASVVKHQTLQLVKNRIIKAHQDVDECIKIAKILGVKRTTACGVEKCQRLSLKQSISVYACEVETSHKVRNCRECKAVIYCILITTREYLEFI